MGSNRKHPFGYKMELGRIVIYQAEARIVRILFCRYDQGDSLATLTDWVRRQGVPYDGDKPWNKNMIARILADDRYLGRKGYPAIITEERFLSVNEKRAKRSASICLTDAQKLLRQKCREKLTAQAQQQVLFLLNWLILYPDKIRTPERPPDNSQKIRSLEAELEEMLMALPVEEERAGEQVFTLAEDRYAELDPNLYETERLRRIFQQLQPMVDLDADLIRRTISRIHISKDGSVTLELKNQQSIESKNCNTESK